MFQSRNDRIDRLAAKVHAIAKGKLTPERIELLESLVGAEITANQALQRVCGVNTGTGPTLQANLAELKRLTGDGDKEWKARLERMATRWETVYPKPKFWEGI